METIGAVARARRKLEIEALRAEVECKREAWRVAKREAAGAESAREWAELEFRAARRRLEALEVADGSAWGPE